MRYIATALLVLMTAGLAVCGFLLIGVFHFLIQTTHLYWLIFLHHIAWFGLFVAVTWYELRERLVAKPQAEKESTPDKLLAENATAGAAAQSQADKLWQKILSVLDKDRLHYQRTERKSPQRH